MRLDDKVATSGCLIYNGKAPSGFSTPKEGNFRGQSCVSPAVHFIAGPHEVLGYLQIPRLPLLSGFHTMMVPQSQQA